MDWLRFVLFGMAAITMVGIGVAEIHGITDATGVVRHDATVPCLITAPIIGLLAAMFLMQAIARSLPVIELYREGITCRLVGRTPGFNLSGKIGLTIMLLSGRGFRQTMYRTDWAAFHGAVITGVPMMYVLTINGTAVDPQGASVTGLRFAQHEFGDSIHDVAAAINRAAQSSEVRNQLPSWTTR
jgi:hypothetical protein